MSTHDGREVLEVIREVVDSVGNVRNDRSEDLRDFVDLLGSSVDNADLGVVRDVASADDVDLGVVRGVALADDDRANGDISNVEVVSDVAQVGGELVLGRDVGPV